MRKTFLISMGSETTLDCLAADRAAVECPEHPGLRRRPTMMVKKMDIPPTASARQAGWVQYLGGMPWDGRATAIEPDAAHVMHWTRNVKQARDPLTSQVRDTYVS